MAPEKHMPNIFPKIRKQNPFTWMHKETISFDEKVRSEALSYIVMLIFSFFNMSERNIL